MKNLRGVLQGVLIAGFLILIGGNLVAAMDFVEPSNPSVQHFYDAELQTGAIVVNEILYRRESAGSPEFVELLNRSADTVNLKNWRIKAGSNSVVIDEEILLRANGYAVFTDHEGFAAQSDDIHYLPQFPVLTDGGSSIVVYNAEGEISDSLNYKQDWGDVSPGISLERKDPDGLSIDPANWSESISSSGSTPGEQNSRYEIDFIPPELLFASLRDEKLSVFFDEFILFTDPNSEDESREPRFSVNDENVRVLEFDPGEADRVILDGSSLPANEELILQADELSDYKGNRTSTEQAVAQPVKPGSLVFNEIMYHPLSETEEFSGQSEYLEIYNRMNYSISLEGLYLHDEPNEMGDYSRMDPVNSKLKMIPPRGFAVLYPEPQEMTLSESRIGKAFGLSKESDPFGLRFERAGMGLILAGRPVYLADSTGTVIDHVHYHPDWHNPNLITTQGISLERIKPDVETNDSSNWSSSTSVMGGTPAAQNSMLQVADGMNGNSEVELSPNPFSPDGDGVDDDLQISFNFDEPNYLVKVRIFDRYGRLVRKLADSHATGLNGSLSWDGSMDDGRSNRVGIYIIHIEAYDASTGKRKEFKETAVLARRF